MVAQRRVGFGALARDIGRGHILSGDRNERPFGGGDSVLAAILDILE
jgi:hypothetical protein